MASTVSVLHVQFSFAFLQFKSFSLQFHFISCLFQFTLFESDVLLLFSFTNSVGRGSYPHGE